MSSPMFEVPLLAVLPIAGLLGFLFLWLPLRRWFLKRQILKLCDEIEAKHPEEALRARTIVALRDWSRGNV